MGLQQAVETMPSPDDAPLLAVGGVIYRRDAASQLELLLIKKRGGFWTLPKGYIKPGEEEHTALAREVFEETGLTGIVETFVQQVSYTIHKRRGPRTKVVTYYCIRALGGTLRPDSKEGIEQVRWFPFATALEQIEGPRIQMVARTAWAILKDSDPGAE